MPVIAPSCVDDDLALAESAIFAQGSLLHAIYKHDVKQVKQLLDFVQQKRAECARRNKTPVILCMDMNAAPPEQGHDYPSEAYPSALAHPIIPLRSAYGVAMDGQEPPWTTWKIRTKGTKRFEIRHTIVRNP